MSSSRQPAAIMFTDIFGRTALIGKDEKKHFLYLAFTTGSVLPMEADGLAGSWNKLRARLFSLGEFGNLDDTKSEFHGTTVS